MKRFATLMAAALLAGCAAPAHQSVPQGALIGTVGDAELYIFLDNEQGNTCYVASRRGYSTVSCVPMAPVGGP